MNFKQFLNILLARYKIAIFVLIATVTLVLLVNLLLPNKYVASTSVLLDVRSPDPLIGLSLGGMAMPSYMATQNEIITSDRVAQSVVKLLKLDENPQIREQWRTATDGKGQLVVWLGKLLAQKLEVKPSRESDVINISFTAEDPAFAALIANAFAQAYINTNLELKVEPAKQYAQWFQLRAKELRAELEQTQARLAAFQKKSGMVSVGSRMQSVENSKIAELSGQLVLNETQLAEIQSKRQSAGDTLVDVMQNSTIQNLKTEIIRLEVKLQELSRNLGKNHPQYQAMEGQITTLKQKLNDETQQILSSINTANRVSVQKGSALKATIETHKRKAIQDSGQRDQIAVLENDVESAQKAYDVLVQRYTESNLKSQSNQTNISVLTPATEPTDRSSPKIYMNLLLAVFGGTLLGVGAIFVTEMFNPRIRTMEALLAATSLPVLVEFAREKKPSGTKKWLKKIIDALMLKLKPRKTLATA
jgi:chain length determinant protein EpsF